MTADTMNEKIAPVQGFTAGIPWSLHLEAYDAYSKKWSPQPALIDLEGRNCRGGFSVGELDEFVPGWRDKVSEIGKLRAKVTELTDALASRSRAASEPGEVARLERALNIARGYVGKYGFESERAILDATINRLASMATSPASEAQVEPSMREFLGKLVRAEWITWAAEQPNPKSSWLQPWESLTDPEREVDRRIGERVWKFSYVREASAPLPASSPVAAEGQKAVAQEHAENILNSWLDNQHADDVAVDAFASKMRQKMAAARAKGRGGWDDKTQCSAETLSRMLREHVDKGDPVDVANFAMMLGQRGERIATPTASMADAAEAVVLRDPRMEKFDRYGPLPGMIAAFEAHYGQSWTDKDWRDETSTWAAAWSRASAARSSTEATPGPRGENAGGVVEALTDAAREVLGERSRQVSVEGWTPEHDDEHREGEMCYAAAGYACAASDALQAIEHEMDGHGEPTLDDDATLLHDRPWPNGWTFKSAPPRRQLIKAGALILAEIERIDRGLRIAEKGDAS